MFWGVTLENDKRYTQTVEASFHLAMAALDPNPPSTADVGKSPTVSVWLQHDKAEFLLCTLEYGKLYQQPLDCNFTEGEEVTFFVNGKGVIHLTGYLIEDLQMPEDSMVDPMISTSEDEDDDSEESEDIPVLVDAKQYAKSAKKRNKDMESGIKKKMIKMGEEDDSSSDYSDSGDDDDDDDDDEDDDEDVEEEEEEESSEEDSEEDSEDSEPEKKAIKAKPENAKKNNSNSLNQSQTKGNGEQMLSKKLKKEKKNSANSSGGSESLDKSSLDASLNVEKKKKKKKKKAKTQESSNNSAPNAKQDSSKSSEETKNNPRVLASGLVVEDTHLGQGAEARIGRQVHVYYSGKLVKNGKMFDKCQGGKPFRFTLGKGEVIAGWEKGLVGMRVGGKRKLTVPAKLGYGNQQTGPIPPNSSLVFDIELKGLS